METHALTVSHLPSLEEILSATSPGEAIPMPPSVSSTGSFLNYVDGLHNSTSLNLRFLEYLAAGSGAALALGTAALFSKPLIDPELYNQIAASAFLVAFIGGGILLLSGPLGITAAQTNSWMRRARDAAHQLADDGFVFASDLTSHILPLHARKTVIVPISRYRDHQYTADFWSAVQPSSIQAYHATVDSLPRYVNQAVIVTGTLSSAPVSEDMEAQLNLNARLDGNMMGVPLSGTISGEARGPVSSKKRFRLMDPSTGISAAVVVDAYVPNNGVMPPYELMIIAPDFGINQADPNRLVQSLAEARSLGSPVIVIGRVDPSGQIRAETIKVSGGREAYFLAVYEPPPLLKGR